MSTAAEQYKDAQFKFSRMVPRLLDMAHDMGYEVRGGEWWRSPQEAERQGKKNSLHCDGLAIDLNFFENGKYISNGDQLHDIGKFWEDIGGTWGGRFKTNPDGNHFSLSYGGRK